MFLYFYPQKFRKFIVNNGYFFVCFIEMTE